MNVLALPRTAAALEYRALRLPATVVEKQLVARLLADDSALRLGFERALGTLDRTAGQWFADEALVRRGDALVRRSDALARAAELEEQAAQQQAEADQALQAEKARAGEQREQARRAQQQRTRATLAEEQAAKREVAQQAGARAAARTSAVEREAAASVAAERQRLEAQESAIGARTKARTAAPEAQLEHAVDRTARAAAERAEADRLAQLADAEKAGRQAARR